MYSETCIKQTRMLGRHPLLSGQYLESQNFPPTFTVKSLHSAETSVKLTKTPMLSHFVAQNQQ